MDLDVIQNRIFEIRGQRVMLDFHLAELYEVETRTLKQAVRRNIERFPRDFMFEISMDEYHYLRSQFVTLNWISIKYAPFVFTELGVAMLSSVLKSEKAIRVNIEVMRAFVNMRKLSMNYAELVDRIDSLEENYDKQFAEVFKALRILIEPPKTERRKIGYITDQKK